LLRVFGQKGNREPNEKNRLDQDDRKLKVRRNSTADTIMIRPRLAAFPKTDQDKNEKSGPTGKQRAHEPVRELEDVVDLVAMFGCIRRLAEKFVNEREAIHLRRDLRSIARAAESASGHVAKCCN